MNYISKLFPFLFFCVFTPQTYSSQNFIQIETEIEINQDLLPQTTIPYINVEFVERNTLTIRKEPKFNSKNPKYGKVILGNSPESQNIVIVLDETKNLKKRIFVDANNNKDLTDDGDFYWSENIEGNWTKEVNINVSLKDKGETRKVDLPFLIVRYENAETKQIRLTLRPSYIRKGKLILGAKTYKVLAQTVNKQGLFSNPQDITLGIDTNQDGIIDKSLLSAEIYWGGKNGGKPFNIAGETFYIARSSASGDTISLARSSEKVSPKNYVVVGEISPYFSFKDLQGRAFDLKNFKNKVVLLDFWAMWCSPCVKNLPDIKKIAEKFSESDLVVVGISLDGGETSETSISELRQFVEEQEINWQIVFDNGGMESKMAKDFNIVDIPLYIVIDKKGVIQLIERGGGEEKMNRIERTIQKLIEK